ncbi:MAG: sphingosine/diacylglycerol kinaselike enzyme [Segetibacter sp.]|nr:sphingosine/diacylglycerol kinaselike enzyme [Segetibacter sp.]
MKVAKLLHNPKAGDEDHGKEELVSQIKAAGFECRYSSTKGWNWDEFEEDIDFVIVAGGDGTVRKITKELLDRKILDKTFPIALLPLGTANNISKTLQIEGKTEDIIQSWHNEKIKKYDVGRIYNVEGTSFFLESFGYGLFPYLMQEMEKVDKASTDTPEKSIQAALKELYKITLSYTPKDCKLTIDGIDHSGRFLLAEVMNIRSIGPNLFLSPNGDPGDGEMEVVLLPEKDKEKFAAYIAGKINSSEENYDFKIIKAKEVQISWNGTHVHADDEVIKIEDKTEVSIQVKPGLLEFMVP